MRIDEVHLVNYRNFVNEKIKFNHKSLVIGSNDVGKSNLMMAIRLLLDPKLSFSDLSPKDSDFSAHSKDSFFSITIKFVEVTQDCIISSLKGKISEDDVLYMRYFAKREASGKKSYELHAGDSLEALEPLQSRVYLKYLNFEYLRSNRDLSGFLKKEKRKLFENKKNDRTNEEIVEDEKLISGIKESLDGVNSNISNLSFIKSTLDGINSEIVELSAKPEVEFLFDSGASNPDEYINRVDLVAESDGERVSLGGDGTNNQLFITMWCPSREKDEDVEGVTIYGIEEPEAHLHPHNQRALASYLNDKISSQIILTSHSPQITCEFSPNSIIRLFHSSPISSHAASGGCSQVIEDSIFDFGYRLNIVPAEAFFANCVFLVEGPSEVMLYKSLSREMKFDLDKLNISILSVNGIGFLPYVKLFQMLHIPVVLRTDNDLQKSTENQFILSGFRRILGLAQKYFQVKFEKNEIGTIHKKYKSKEISPAFISLKDTQKKMEDRGIFLANINLEKDLINSPLKGDLFSYYSVQDDDDLYREMTKAKGQHMYRFLLENSACLNKLEGNCIMGPLLKSIEIVNGKDTNS